MKKIQLVVIGVLLLSIVWLISPIGYLNLFDKRKITLNSEVSKALEVNMNHDFDKKEVIRPLLKTHLILFKKEKRVEIWVIDHVNQPHLMLSDSVTLANVQNGTRLYNDETIIPEGLYEVKSINSNALSFQISFPNIFDIEKQKTDKRPELNSEITFQIDNGNIKLPKDLMTTFLFLADETDVKNTNIIILPNDFRNDKNIPYCATCPHWIEELYGSLRLIVADFTIEIQ